MYSFLFLCFIFLILKYFSKKVSNEEVLKTSDKTNRELMEKIYSNNLTLVEKKEIYEKFGHRCYKCGSKKKLSIDHHLPLSFGYKLSKDNAVILCKKCNNKKSNLMPNKFYSAEELDILEKKYGIRNQAYKINLQLKDLKKENIKISFDYLGKNIQGISFGLLEERDRIYNKKRRIFLRLKEEGEFNLYLIDNIKNLQREDERNANI